MKNLFKLYKYLDNYFWKLLGVILVSTLVAVMQSVMPLVVKQIITVIGNSAGSKSLTPQIIFWLAVILAAGLIGNIAMFFQDKYQNVLGVEVAHKVRNKVFRITLSLTPSHVEHEGAGKIIQRINEGVSQFRNWIGTASYVLSNVIFVIIAFIVIFSKSPLSALIFCIVFAPIQIYVIAKKLRLTRPMYKKWQEAGSRSMGLLSETLSNLAMVRSLSAEDALQKKYNSYNEEVFGLQLETNVLERRYNTARDILGQSYQFLAIAIATISAVYGKLSPADIFVFAYFASNLTNSLNPIARIVQTTTEADVAAGRLIEFLETKPSLTDKADALPLTALETIEFKNVSFGYPDGKKGAIRNISFKIEGGKTVALVGPSGTGKSTITKLLLRFYEPSDGQILINGKDVSTFTQESIRQHIGMVMQDVALFNTTVDENLGMANARADKAAIVQAAKQAHADEFIQDLPKKYKTLVGERGVKLSGGQKQRVAIARAILKDPQLIILDEATSALDSESERLVQDGLKKLMAGRSALVIAHRLSTIMHADEILVLKNGMVAERGTHSELINQTGLYKKLFNLQSSSGKVKL
jgi:ABC-type multidrug transport system fused ATPase/permease subunit